MSRAGEDKKHVIKIVCTEMHVAGDFIFYSCNKGRPGGLAWK